MVLSLLPRVSSRRTIDMRISEKMMFGISLFGLVAFVLLSAILLFSKAGILPCCMALSVGLAFIPIMLVLFKSINDDYLW